jgi:hypothetical protein
VDVLTDGPGLATSCAAGVPRTVKMQVDLRDVLVYCCMIEWIMCCVGLSELRFSLLQVAATT